MVTTLEARVPLALPLISMASELRGRASRGLKQSGIIPLEGLLPELEASWQCRGPGWERRQHHRYGYQQSTLLVPLDEQSELPSGPALQIETRDISANGIGFVHSVPLPYRKVSLTLVLPGGAEIVVVTRLLWCRFTREGNYESGGQFVRCSGL